jgi:hypothetical protein
MKKLIFALLLTAAALLQPAPRLFQTAASAQTVVTAAQVNGTWETKHGEFKVWALGNQKLRVEFSGTYEYQSPAGPMANTGEGRGVARIEGDTAVFKPEGAEDECKIIMRFTRGKLVVTQEGVCGFGNKVTAEGTYRRTSTRKPKFGESGER